MKSTGPSASTGKDSATSDCVRVGPDGKDIEAAMSGVYHAIEEAVHELFEREGLKATRDCYFLERSFLRGQSAGLVPLYARMLGPSSMSNNLPLYVKSLAQVQSLIGAAIMENTFNRDLPWQRLSQRRDAVLIAHHLSSAGKLLALHVFRKDY